MAMYTTYQKIAHVGITHQKVSRKVHLSDIKIKWWELSTVMCAEYKNNSHTLIIYILLLRKFDNSDKYALDINCKLSGNGTVISMNLVHPM